MTRPTKETIATVARYIAALHHEAHASTQLANALQQLNDAFVVMADNATVDIHTYTHAKLILADAVTHVITANHVVTAANDELRRATLEFSIAMENNQPDALHPNHN